MKICLAGDGWGAISAFKSLTKYFDNIFLLTEDKDLIELARFNDKLVSSLIDFDFDYIVCAGFKPIVKRELTDKKNIINIHYSLLPKYRGLHSTVWAILNGEEELGLTIHIMNEGIDDGPIIHQERIEYKSQTSKEIMEICNLFIENELGFIVNQFINNKITPVAQNKDNATWVCKRNINDCIIDYEYSIAFLRNFFKALVKPYPLPILLINNNKYQVENFLLIEQDYYMSNGRVVNIDDEGVWIKVSDGLLIVKKIRDINGKEIELTALFKIGMRLNNESCKI